MMKEPTLLAESLSYILVGYLYIKLMYYRKEKLSELFFYNTEIIIGLFLACLGITNSILILLGIGISIDIKYIIFYGAFFILVPISYYLEKEKLEKLDKLNINENDKLRKKIKCQTQYITQKMFLF